MSPSKVLKFPGGQVSDFNLKLFAIIFYCFLAYMLTLGTGLSENGFMVLIVLGLLYNFLVRQGIRNTNYLQQNKVLLIVLLVVAIIAFQWAMIPMILLAGIYWLLVGRSGREAPYFLRFHILTGLILNFFILLPYLLLRAFLELVQALLSLTQMPAVIFPVASVISVLPTLFLGIFAGAALWLSVSALMGRTPYIALVTSNVRNWA
jgi:hypothetical protein